MFVLILPFAWFGGSILIILIAIFALYIMKKDQSFMPIINAKKYMKAYLIVVALGMTIITSLVYYNYNEKDYSYDYSAGSYNKVYNENIKSGSTNIVGRDNLSSYSVADEMLKWNDLLEKGLISKEEFEKAKAKLMNGEKV